MNSTGLSRSPPLSEAGTKSSSRPKSPDEDDKEKHTHIRFLLSNTAAGSIIGKGGSTITEFQSQSGARIQLSKDNELFPGTSDRIIRISGELNEITKATKLILEKLLNEAEENHDDDNRTKARFIVPNSSCGAIIGKGRSTIKSLIEESQADIKISPQGRKYARFNDRLVTVTGSLEEHMRAITLIVSKLAEDAHYKQSMNLPFSHGGEASVALLVGLLPLVELAGMNFACLPAAPVGYINPPAAHTTNYGSNGIGGKHTSIEGTIPARSLPKTNDVQGNSTTLGVPDEHIGAVVGRGGRNILEITQVSGAKIKISDRGDFMSGTSDRKVTIIGTPEAIRTAEAMIMQRVSANADR